MQSDSRALTKSILTSAIMLAVTIVVISIIFSTEPKAQKDGATKRTPMLVEVMPALVQDNIPLIRAYGVVMPAQAIDLKPRVSGEVVAVAERFVPGNFIKKDQWLIRLDPTDYELALEIAQAELSKAESAYQIELGEQIRAQKAFELVSDNVAKDNKALILREPQKKQADAELRTARAAVTNAQLALDRTTITMPFDGQILSRGANLGSQLSPSTMLAEIIGTETYWIESSLPLSQLTWLAPPAESDTEANVIIRNKTAWQIEHSKRGKLIQIISTLDESSRMARVLIEVDDPLGLNENDDQIGDNPLIAGTYVETDLPAKPISNSVRIPVEYLRKRNTVWIKKDNKLDIREVTVAFKDEAYSYISSGIEDGEQIITTDISAVKQGATVQLKSASTNSSQAE